MTAHSTTHRDPLWFTDSARTSYPLHFGFHSDSDLSASLPPHRPEVLPVESTTDLSGVILDTGSWYLWGEPDHSDPNSAHIAAYFNSRPNGHQIAALRDELIKTLTRHFGCQGTLDRAMHLSTSTWSEDLCTWVAPPDQSPRRTLTF